MTDDIEFIEQIKKQVGDMGYKATYIKNKFTALPDNEDDFGRNSMMNLKMKSKSCFIPTRKNRFSFIFQNSKQRSSTNCNNK